MPQLPDTLKVSVFDWAIITVLSNRDTAARENIFNVFIVNEFIVIYKKEYLLLQKQYNMVV